MKGVLAGVVALSLVVGACGSSGPSTADPAGQAARDGASPAPGGQLPSDVTLPPNPTGEDIERAKAERLAAGSIPRSLSATGRVQDFFIAAADEADLDFAPLDSDDLQGAAVGSLVGCPGDELPAEVVFGNAFAIPCDSGPVLVFGGGYVPYLDGLEELLDNLGGPAGLGLAAIAHVIDEFVVAHEFAHAVQFQNDLVGPGVLTELTADCMAGAYVAHAIDEGLGPFADPDSLSMAIVAALGFRDGGGAAADDPWAHGTGVDRVTALLDGHANGIGACAGYLDDPPDLIQLNRQELAAPVPLPSLDSLRSPEEGYPTLTRFQLDLKRFFEAEIDGYEATYTPNPPAWAYMPFGWFAIATSVGSEFTWPLIEAARRDPYTREGTETNVCLLSAWLADVIERSPDLPRDPAEVDIGFIGLVLQSGEHLQPAEVVSAMRAGMAEGAESCLA